MGQIGPSELCGPCGHFPAPPATPVPLAVAVAAFCMPNVICVIAMDSKKL